MTQRALAVAVHDVEPATFERVQAIREWLLDHGVEHATLLVIPAADGAPLVPEHLAWLRQRVVAGDAIAQHGFRHRQHRSARRPRQWVARRQGGAAAEFPGLDWRSTARLVDAGRATLEQAGLAVHGFVAPAYAYTAALRAILASRFEWWAGLLALHVRPPTAHAPIAVLAPAHGLGTSTAIKRRLSPPHLRASVRFAGHGLRLDIHPADFDHPRHVAALEAALQRARERRPVTYDELVTLIPAAGG